MPITLGILAQSRQAVAAGAMDLLETQVLTGSQASVTFSGLSAYASTYKHLQIRAVTKSNRTSRADQIINMTFNGDTTLTNYRAHTLGGTGSSVFSDDSVSYARNLVAYGAGDNGTDVFGASVIDILDAFSTTKNKTSRGLSGVANSAVSTPVITLTSHLWMNTNALTSLTLENFSSFTFYANSRFSLYGVK